MEALPTLTITATDPHTQSTTQVTERTQFLDQLTSQMTNAINNLSRCPTRSLSPDRCRYILLFPWMCHISINFVVCYHHRFGDRGTTNTLQVQGIISHIVSLIPSLCPYSYHNSTILENMKPYWLTSLYNQTMYFVPASMIFCVKNL